jgi:hypothetical protein
MSLAGLPPASVASHGHPQVTLAAGQVPPTIGRLPADRPIIKLSVSLIETYKEINKVRVSLLACLKKDDLLVFCHRPSRFMHRICTLFCCSA